MKGVIVNLKNINVKWGYIYMCDFGIGIDSEQGGIRPVLIVKNQKGIDNGTVVTVIPITSKVNKGVNLPTHIAIGSESGLTLDSELMIEQVKTISKRRLLFENDQLKEIGQVNKFVLKKVQTALLKDMGFMDIYFDEKYAFKLLYMLEELKRANNPPATSNFVLIELKNYCGKYNKNYNDIYKMYMLNKLVVSNVNSTIQHNISQMS